MNKKQKNNLIRIIVSAVLMVVLHFLPVDGWLKFALYMVPYLVVGYDIIIKAWKGIKNKQPLDECLLMTIATIGAIAIALIDTGDYVEAVAVMLFYQIGEWFQSYAVTRSRKNITELMDIRPDYANVEVDGRLTKVDPDDVEIGTIIVCQPGEKIPIDGVIVEGDSTLDTKALTGESLPARVGLGDSVLSGTINMTGVLRIRTEKEFGESTASKILEMIEDAGAKKAKSEDFISKFARVYTPAVVISAIALAFLPPIVRLIIGMSPAWTTWLYRALIFLVISCPCALVISIPLSFFAGIGKAGKEGVLIKGSNYMETLANTAYLVCDKTGTLTKGVFKVVAINPAENNGEAAAAKASEEILYYATHAECASPHPIAKSLMEAYGGEVMRDRVTDIEEIAGRGVRAYVRALEPGELVRALEPSELVRSPEPSSVNRALESSAENPARESEEAVEVLVGNKKLMEESKVLGFSDDQSNYAGTVVYVAARGRYLGSILISDEIKETSPEAISELRRLNVSQVVMLTGDREEVAREVADALGIKRVYSGLLPMDKVKLVEELIGEKKEGEALVFVGDGINDAPVLSRADVGIAMGALGSDAAIEAADVVLMDDDPKKIAKAIEVSRKCLRIVKENIWFAIGVKLICLLLGALGLAGMWLAIFADVGVMVLAVLNAIRVLF